MCLSLGTRLPSRRKNERESVCLGRILSISLNNKNTGGKDNYLARAESRRRNHEWRRPELLSISPVRVFVSVRARGVSLTDCECQPSLVGCRYRYRRAAHTDTATAAAEAADTFRCPRRQRCPASLPSELCVVSVTQIQYQTCYYSGRFCARSAL